MKLSIIGDICPARLISSKFSNDNYQIVHKDIISFLAESNYVIANLESPICKIANNNGDHLSFKAKPDILQQFSFIDFFSLSNNHINDCGTNGIDETIEWLQEYNIAHNGLFRNSYTPIIIDEGTCKIAIFTCTDMMNIPFSDTCHWNTLHIDDKYLDDLIIQYKKKGYFIILYPHVGILFSRFVNPKIRTLLHDKILLGTDLIVTAHAHCIGGMESFKGKYIFHSLGDFVMDGGSYRRRQSCILTLTINDNIVNDYEITPTVINDNLETVLAKNSVCKSILRSWDSVSNRIKHNSTNYNKFFKTQYKKEMFLHSSSTLRFLYNHKGLRGTLQYFLKRHQEVSRMLKWIVKDRSKDRRDDEAISPDRKMFSEKDLY